MDKFTIWPNPNRFFIYLWAFTEISTVFEMSNERSQNKRIEFLWINKHLTHMLVNSLANPFKFELNLIKNLKRWRNKHLKSYWDEQRTKLMINDFLRKLRTILWKYWWNGKMGAEMRTKIDIEFVVRMASTWVVSH